ncbi:MAG TPA: DUF1579 domain-containing protein [Microlunatus sp.]
MSVLEVFAPLFGHWQGSEELSASPWGRAGTARAALSFRVELGGGAVVNDYRRVREDGTEFLGHGVFLVDSAAEVSWWLFDSYGYPPVPARGGWRDGELMLTKTTEQGRAEHRFGFTGEDLSYAIDLTLEDAGPLPFLRGRYRSISGH